LHGPFKIGANSAKNKKGEALTCRRFALNGRQSNTCVKLRTISAHCAHKWIAEVMFVGAPKSVYLIAKLTRSVQVW